MRFTISLRLVEYRDGGERLYIISKWPVMNSKGSHYRRQCAGPGTEVRTCGVQEG